MNRFSAQFTFTNSGPPLKRAVITAADDGTIISIENNAGSLRESQSVEFYNGIIIPGFVNCHYHLELSHLKDIIQEGKGLGDFIMSIRSIRNSKLPDIETAARNADNDMYREGVQLCADICNTSETFKIKSKSSVRYINLIEVFGIDPEKARRRYEEIMMVTEEAERCGLTWSLVPHSVYSVSLPLFRLLKEKTENNKITSIHFMETEGESLFLSDHSGAIRESYDKTGLFPDHPDIPVDHAITVINEVTSSGNLILVHNTFADKKTIRAVQKRKNTYWCLCPNSNLYIENELPPVDMLKSEGCEIVIGTDSLASNKKISILSELKTLQYHFPSITLVEMIRWATINGARALGEEQNFGKIEVGMTPGLLLLENTDLINFKLLPETFVTRLL
ncbi:MAG: amidohydrolase family protein [Bacteroidales bacterium]|jgi:cytosine/adenosine deaminase-related metal-dependent hydrolase|nr:amidohydrolase family protein [Bacteroidales bacterium]